MRHFIRFTKDGKECLGTNSFLDLGKKWIYADDSSFDRVLEKARKRAKQLSKIHNYNGINLYRGEILNAKLLTYHSLA